MSLVLFELNLSSVLDLGKTYSVTFVIYQSKRVFSNSFLSKVFSSLYLLNICFDNIFFALYTLLGLYVSLIPLIVFLMQDSTGANGQQ